MEAKSSNDDVLRAAGEVGALLPRLASVGIGLSFVAYFVGWREAEAYFSTVGAPWVISLIGASRFLYLSGPLVGGVLLCAFFSVHALGTETVGVKGLWRCSIGAFLLATLLIVFKVLVPPTAFSPRGLWYLALAAGFCFAIGAGGVVGLVVGRLKESEMRWTVSHAYMIYIAVFAGLYTMPALMGSARARHDLASMEDRLPAVRLLSSTTYENWRLVEAVNESALLIDRQAVSGRPLFRIVKMTEISSVNAIESKATN